jgi:hypothetical protein
MPESIELLPSDHQTIWSLRRHILEFAKRIDAQTALIANLLRSEQNANEAVCTLRALTRTLALTCEHLKLLETTSAQRKRSEMYP